MDREGRTSLIYAVAYNDLECTKVLLSYGAGNIGGGNGISGGSVGGGISDEEFSVTRTAFMKALQYAKKSNNSQMVALLASFAHQERVPRASVCFRRKCGENPVRKFWQEF
jgi:ankyrin repeat protein